METSRLWYAIPKLQHPYSNMKRGKHVAYRDYLFIFTSDIVLYLFFFFLCLFCKLNISLND